MGQKFFLQKKPKMTKQIDFWISKLPLKMVKIGNLVKISKAKTWNFTWTSFALEFWLFVLFLCQYPSFVDFFPKFTNVKKLISYFFCFTEKCKDFRGNWAKNLEIVLRTDLVGKIPLLDKCVLNLEFFEIFQKMSFLA